jgi:streptomycin 6-kinase
MGRPSVTDLPPEFLRSNQVDPDWLTSLPRLLDTLARRWGIVLEPHFDDIRINYVAPATRTDGTRCVIKVSRHVDETRNEIAALRLWAGDGVARLLEADPDAGALLLERIDPGTLLVDTAAIDDEAATRTAAGVLRELWRPVREPHGLRSLDSWCGAYDQNRAALSRGEGGFPAALFQRADAMRQHLLDSTRDPVALHGDLHHFNILRSGTSEWLAIDPKGLVGDRCFDICQFLKNPGAVPLEVNRRRVDVFCGELGLDRSRTRDWCFVHGILDACWDFEDGNAWQAKVAYAEETLSL